MDGEEEEGILEKLKEVNPCNPYTGHLDPRQISGTTLPSNILLAVLFCSTAVVGKNYAKHLFLRKQLFVFLFVFSFVFLFISIFVFVFVFLSVFVFVCVFVFVYKFVFLFWMR